MPLDLTVPIINTIKNNSLFVVYYPSDNWFLKSKYLNCTDASLGKSAFQSQSEINMQPPENDREAILFADLNANKQREENEPILVVTADNYKKLFHTKVPLERMLRRQINHIEYIALSNAEFNRLVLKNPGILNDPPSDSVSAVHLVIPEIKMERGYYLTQMKIISLGKIKEVKLNSTGSVEKELNPSYTLYFENKPAIKIKSTNHFIRWLGL